MRSNHIVLAVALGVGATAAASYGDELAQPATTSAALQAPAAATATATATATAKETTTVVAAKVSDADEQRLLVRGYKKEVHKGQTVYCRTESKPGSRLESKQCGTAQSVALAEQHAQDLMQNSQYLMRTKVNNN